MKKMSKKIKLGDTICWVFIILFVFASCIMPKTGRFVLLDELFEVLLIWMVSGYVIMKIIISQSARSVAKKTARIVIIIVCAVSGLWCAKNVVLDLVTGTKEIHMSDCTVSRMQGTSGILSRHYYLEGTGENGKKMRVEISGKDYTSLLHKKNVAAEYYCHTDRIAEFW